MKILLERKKLIETSKVLAGVGAGFSFFWLISHPDSHVKKKIPQKNIKNFHFLPNLKFTRKDKVYHFHHWVIFLSFYLPLLLTRKKILGYKILHGFIIGSILQGLSFK